MGNFYIFGTIFFTVYGQLVLKWRINGAGALPENLSEKLYILFKLLFDLVRVFKFLCHLKGIRLYLNWPFTMKADWIAIWSYNKIMLYFGLTQKTNRLTCKSGRDSVSHTFG